MVGHLVEEDPESAVGATPAQAIERGLDIASLLPGPIVVGERAQCPLRAARRVVVLVAEPVRLVAGAEPQGAPLLVESIALCIVFGLEAGQAPCFQLQIGAAEDDAEACPFLRLVAAAGPDVTLRTYRLALVTDPTYATYFGAANVTAAKVTLMNRVDQIYEDELAIRRMAVP